MRLEWILIGGFFAILIAAHFYDRWRGARLDALEAAGLAPPPRQLEQAKPPYRAPFIAIWFIGLMLAVAFPGFYVYERLATAGSEDWQSVTGRVVERHYVVDRGYRRSTSYDPRITYSYQVGGRTFTHDDIWLTIDRGFSQREEAIAFLDDYPVGREVQVFYAPDNPQRAALIMERHEGLWPLWLGAVGVALAILGWTFRYPAAYRRQRRDARASGL